MPKDYEGLYVEKVSEGVIPVGYTGDIDEDCWGNKRELGYSCIPEKDIVQVMKDAVTRELSNFLGGETLAAFVDMEREYWKSRQHEDHEELALEIRYYFEILSLLKDKAYLIPIEIKVTRSLYLDEDEEKRFRNWLVWGGEPVGFLKSYDVFEIENIKYEVYEVIGGPEKATSWREFSSFVDIREL